MADQPDPEHDPLPNALPDPAERGATTVADRVIEKIARQAARTSTPTTPRGVTGGGLPAVHVTVAGDHARVTARVAAPWGAPPSGTAAAAARSIREHLERLAQITVDTIDVTVGELVLEVAPRRRVR